MLTTKTYGQEEKEQDVNQKRCDSALSQLFRMLEECSISDNAEVREAYMELQKTILKANKESK